MSQVGLDCKLYENTATYATPNWIERNTVQGVDVADSNTSPEAANRVTRVKTFLHGMDEWALKFTVMRDTEDAFYKALRDAKRNRTTLDLAVMSGDITTAGSDGYRAEWKVEQFDNSEPMDDTNVISVTLKPAKTANAPVYMDIT